MNVKILQALELAGVLTISETESEVTVTLHIDKSTNEAPALPAPVRGTRLGKVQRLVLRTIESHGPAVDEILAAVVRGSVRVPVPYRDTRQQRARQALRVLHERGLVEIIGDYVKLINT